MRAFSRITTVVVAAVVSLIVLELLSVPALAAKKKKRRSKSDTLAVVVLPFVGKGTGGADAKEAVELELELVDEVQVSASDAVENDLRGAGKKAYDAALLTSVLQKRGVDVLLRGERGPGEKSPDALLITAYGKDGQPRFFKELPLNAETDQQAGAIVTALKPAFAGWKSLKPIKIGAADDDDKPKIRAEDVLADDDPDKHPQPKKETKPAVVARDNTPKGKGSVIDDDDPPAKPDKPKVDKAEKKTGSPLDFNSDPADNPDKPKKKQRHLDDDGPPKEEKIARTDIDENGRKHAVIDDASDTAKPPETAPKLGHTLALSGAFDGATWYYGFDGGGVGDNQVVATFYPGGSASVDFWPLSFLGVDGEVAVAAVPFKINPGPVVVNPPTFTAIQTRVAVALKARYTLKNGIGLGVRAGYRYFGATTETQFINDNGTQRDLTVVPGFLLHAGAVGAEVFLPILVGNHRLELEVKADGLPLTYYDEKPDNPGATTLAIGWAASLGARYDIASGFFGELRAQSTGAQITYTEKGSRLALVGQQLKQLQGGSVLNLTAGFSAGIGFMF